MAISSFPREGSVTPSAIGTIVVTLKDSVADGQSAHFQVQVLDASGQTMTVRKGDLVPHLTAQQVTALKNFMSALRAQAVAEILPA